MTPPIPPTAPCHIPRPSLIGLLRWSLPAFALLSLLAVAGRAEVDWERGQPIQLADSPALSPDGSRLFFTWAGDIWSVRSQGGAARRLTSHPAQEGHPAVSPDGARVAFTSNRTGSHQVWTMAAEGGVPRQVTFHSQGSRVVQWYPDGESLLVEATRDFATRSASRFYRVAVGERRAASLLFDAEGHSPSLSPDGSKLLFCREAPETHRRGYHGSRASQIWLAEELETPRPAFTRLIARSRSARSPLWKPDGSGFYYLRDHARQGLTEIWEHDLDSGEERRLTRLREDPAFHPALSRDGSTLVFRQGFALKRLEPETAGEGEARPKPVRLRAAGDTLPDFTERRSFTKADNLSFSDDGLEVALAAGGDLWVMDTELREPVPVTQTPDEEREPVFSRDGETLFFIRDSGDRVDLWAAERADPGDYWWRNREFVERRLTDDGAAKNDLQLVPGGERISWISGVGDLWTAKTDGSDARRLLASWNQPSYDWSPDGQWIAYAVSDPDFNRDVWIARADGEGTPYNLSRHPDNDYSPAWSPDGKLLAFTGRREDKEIDIHYVYLSLAEEEKGRRERTLESAMEKMGKLRKKAPAPAKPEPAKPEPAKPEPAKPEPAKPEPADSDPSTPGPGATKEAPAPSSPPRAPEAAKPTLPEVTIDFEGLAERVKRISIPGSTESALFWSHDGKRLAFTRDIRGSRSTYTVTFPDKLTPVRLSTETGSLARWIARDDTLLWLVDGVPAALSKGNLARYSFTARQSHDRREYWRVAFLQIWRTMGEVWYDESLNHLDWGRIREKYEDAAAAAPDSAAFDQVVSMMLGELNGSHLGFSSNTSPSWRAPGAWSETTAHLGVVFDRFHQGPGLRVAKVLPKGPADRSEGRLSPGDFVLAIDGQRVGPGTDLTLVLNGLLPRDVTLTLAAPPEPGGGKSGGDSEEPSKPTDPEPSGEEDSVPPADPADPADPAERTLVIRPITYTAARDLLQEALVEERREVVDRLSGGRLGYVLVPRMQWDEFVKFQEELFARGAGKDGLIIDVRDNGGGFTADHLLTALTPAEHAITVARGGAPGYPQDRRVYATWGRPITVLCNQNSFSNAEIFSHAIKELGRGRLVGVATAGGVVSTGSTRIRDVGTLRVPYRGWFRKSDGADMELNGAEPDLRLWNLPGDTARGRDRQLEKAVEVLLEDVEAAKAKAAPALTPASQRGREAE